MLRAAGLARWPLSLALLACLSGPSHAQYIYLDTNADGVNSDLDQICPSGPTAIDIYLDTSANRDGTPAACPTGPDALSFNAYEFILRVTGGTLSWGAYTNRIPGFATRATRDSRDTTEVAYYHNGWMGSSNEAPGLYRLGTLTVTRVTGNPAVDIVAAHPGHGWMATGFGTPCAATAARGHWPRLGAQWFDADGVRFTVGGADVDKFPVSFSVNGPIDPNTEGIRDLRATPESPQVPDQPGNVYGFGIRAGPVPQAAGLATTRPGDVFDFAAAPVPSDAVLFQSEPTNPLLTTGAPAGTNNQILQPVVLGLVSGDPVAPALWTSLIPDAFPRDNIDALSFGEDYFPAGMTVGLDPASTLPDPPTPSGPFVWNARIFGPHKERVVLDHADPVSFRFSVDPWAIGAPCSAVEAEAGAADVGAGLGPWTSPGGAAGDVFGTRNLRRSGGTTVGMPGNALVHDHADLGLAPDPPPLSPMEDDLDALECVGPSTDWVTGLQILSGSIHQRVAHGAGQPDLGTPLMGVVHVPRNSAPIFFSVTRNSTGGAGSAVRSQFVNDGGAAGDIFVTARHPVSGASTNLLFIDETQIGLYAADASPGTTGPDDHSDDLDALLLRVCPEYRDSIAMLIDTLLVTQGGPLPWTTDGATGARTGGGMTVPIIDMIGTLPTDCIQVGFSVTTDAVGRDYTAVDWEAQPFEPPGAGSSAAGDIFYALPAAGGATNFLWFRETDLGLDPGTWINGTSTSLADLADNLDGLDSTDSTGTVTAVETGDSPVPKGSLRFARIYPNPIRFSSTIRFVTPREGRVRLSVYDVKGRFIASVVDERRPAGIQSVRWDGRTTSGVRAASGVYFLRLQFEEQVRSAKVVLVE